MVDIKKIDDKDFVFLNKPLNVIEDKEFSDFLRMRKKTKKARRARSVKVEKVIGIK